MAGIFSKIGRFFFGSPEKRENVSTLRPEQEQLYNQLIRAGAGPGGQGAFGSAADYYRGLLGGTGGDYEALTAPALRQYYQDIMPDISEQFAGMGAGGLGSSGFRNAQTMGGVDLAERLGAIRANLRHSGAQGLSNIGQMGLGSFSQNMTTQPGTTGLLGSIAPAIGMGLGAGVGMPIGESLGGLAGNWLSNNVGGNKVGSNTNAYGSPSPRASPSIPQSPSNVNSNFQLPGFLNKQWGY